MMLLFAGCLLGAVVAAFLCYSRGYRDGCEDTRLALSKPVKRAG